MQWYLASLTMLLVLATAGFLIGAMAVAPLPARMQPAAREFLCLPLGLAVLVLVATLAGWLGHGFAGVHCAVLTSLLAAAGAWVGRGWLWRRPGRWVRLLAFCVAGSFAVLSPLLFIGSFSAYNDTYIYMTHAQWLQTHGATATASTAGGQVTWAQAVSMQNAGIRLGTSFLLGWVQGGFGREWSYEVFPLAAALGVICGALGVGATVLAACPGRWVEAWLAALAAAGTMNGFVFGAHSGFFAQTWGLAFALAAGGLRSVELGTRAKQSGSGTWRTGVPLGVCLAAAMQCYWDLLPLLGPALAATYLLPWPGRNGAAWRRVWTRAWVPAATCAVLVNAEWLHVVPGLLGNTRAVVGNPVRWHPWDFPAHALGLKASVWQRSTWITQSSHRYFLWLGCVGTVVWLAVMAGSQQRADWRHWRWQASGKRRWSVGPLIPVLVWTGLTLLLFLYFRYVVPSPWRERNPTGWPDGVGQSWSQYKITIWSSAWCVALVATLGTRWTGWGGAKKEKWRRIGWIVALGLWTGTGLGWNGVAAWHGNQLLVDTGVSRNPFAVCLAMRRRLAAIPPSEWIYLDWPMGKKVKFREVMVYFLQGHPLASDWGNDGSLFPYLGPEDAKRTSADCQWILRYQPPAEGRVEGAVGGMTLEKGGR